MKQEDAKKEAQRILHAPEAGAQAMLKPLLDDPQAAALLEKLKQGR